MFTFCQLYLLKFQVYHTLNGHFYGFANFKKRHAFRVPVDFYPFHIIAHVF